jgi:hypothetical protein
VRGPVGSSTDSRLLASSTCGSPQRAGQFLFDSDAGLILKAFARKTGSYFRLDGSFISDRGLIAAMVKS